MSAPGRRVGAEVVRQRHVLVLGVRLHMRLCEGNLQATARPLSAGSRHSWCRSVQGPRHGKTGARSRVCGAGPVWTLKYERADAENPRWHFLVQCVSR